MARDTPTNRFTKVVALCHTRQYDESILAEESDMELVHKLENTVADWYKGAPHLPPNGQVWLWKNVWWIVLIGVIVAVFSLISILGLLMLALGLSAGYAATYGGLDSGFAGLAMISLIVSIIFWVLTIILEAVAIKPLKELQKKGWDLIFIVILLNLAFSVVSLVLSLNIIGLIFTFIWSAIGAYFLFEIRHLYGAKAAKKETVEPTTTQPAN